MNAEFGWGPWFGGFALSVFIGGVVAFVATFVGMAVHVVALAALIGAIPGLALLFLSLKVRRDGFAQGLLTGACVAILLGGFCGSFGSMMK